MGNGNEETGDGFRYHGRGLIQLTGKDNYRRCSQAVFGDDRLLENPDLLATPEGAVASACWYWTSHKCNQIADQNDILHITKVINGGTHGLDDRTVRTHHCLAVLTQ
jgi:putative chitinase